MSRFKILEECKEVAVVHYVDEKGAWGTKGRNILFRSPKSNKWDRIADFPFVLEDLLGWNRLASRGLRVNKCIILPTDSGSLLGIRKGKVYKISSETVSELFQIQGRAPLLRGVAKSKTEEIYFGEYFSNRERGPVHIWAVSHDMASYRKAFTFPAGSIRHIHGLYNDPFQQDRVWVTTGDLNGESFIWFSDDGFQTVTRLGDGTQLWRAVGLLFTEDSVCWFTDTNLADNHFVLMDRDSMKASILFDLDNSTLYSCRTNDGLFIASTIVEEGEFIKSNRATISISDDCKTWRNIMSFEKDLFPKTYFGFGLISFPSGSFSSKEVWISGMSLKGIDGYCKKISFPGDTK